jgi:hypothetical protein
MGDVLVGAVPAPAAPVEAAAKVNPVVAAREARAAKLVSVGKALAAALPSELPAPAEKPVVEAKPVEAKPEPVEAEPTADEPKVEAKTEEPKGRRARRQDEEGARGHRQAGQEVPRRAADCEARVRAEDARERTAFAREKQELAARYGSAEELAKLAERDPLALIRKLRPNMTEDDWEVIGRGAFPFTKAGKNDPRAAEAAKRLEKESTRDSEIAQIRKEYDELMRSRDDRKQAEAQTFVERWTSDAMKAIPADKPTLISRLVAKSPERAKQALLAIGHELEQANDNETPTHAEVIAEYERREREELELRGVDVEALLRPAAAPAPVKSKTLDPEAPKGGTRPINTSATRADKLAAVSQGLQKLSSETT